MFLKFFFKIHYLAFLYAFLIVPLAIMGGFFGAFIAYPFILFALLIPIGPISICVSGTRFLYSLFYPDHNPLLSIALAIALKCNIYIFLRRSKLLNYSAISLLLIITFIIGMIIPGLLILINTTSIPDLENFIVFINKFLPLTISMDLTVLSYVKYRDAINGTASKTWIPILAILWSSAIWLPTTINPGEWPDWIEHIFHPIPLATIITIWITITVAQLVVHIKYYLLARK